MKAWLCVYCGKMNRGDIYKLLALALEEYRVADFDKLAASAGTTMDAPPVRVGREEVSLEVSIIWVDSRQNALRVEITAAGPSCWMTERVNESVIITKLGKRMRP
jgi:hypothetical protein